MFKNVMPRVYRNAEGGAVGDINTAAEAFAELMDDDANFVHKEEAPEAEAPETETVEETKETEPVDEAPKYKVKVQGQELDVSIDELVKGYQLEQDYRIKTQKLAEEKKAWEQSQAQLVQKAVPELHQKITQYEQLLGESVAADQKVDWLALARDNPAEYIEKRAMADARKEEFTRISHERAEQQREQERQELAYNWEQLIAKQPEWKDSAKYAEDSKKIAEYLAGLGVSQERISTLRDHTSVIVANKARLYDELMASKDSAIKKVEKLPPKVERPGVKSSGSAPEKDLFRVARKTGRVDDAAAALEALL